MTSRPIYFDHHATTPVDSRVLGTMIPWMTERFGNPASVNHVYGTEAADAVEQAREQVAALIGADARSLIFTSGATEANNLALKGVMASLPADSHLIINAGEHRAILDPANRLLRQGFRVTILPVDSTGRVTADSLQAALTPETRLVSVMWANNEVGSINPIAEIAAICRARNVLFHCDAVQAAGRIPIDLTALPIDLLSLSAHKLYGPKGVGALFVRRSERRIPIVPLFDGGGHERHLRSGTLPVPLVVGFGLACQIASHEMPEEQTRLARLRDQLWSQISASIDRVQFNGHPTDRLAGNLNISIRDVDGEALMMSLTEIAVSSGSACTSANPEPSHVLRAMGVNDSLTRASLRFGLGRGTTEEQINFATGYLAETVRRLRG